MQNTDCSCFCEYGGRTKVISILGKPVTVKSYICSPDGIHYQNKPEQIKLQLSVCPTTFCPGKCPFCMLTDTAENRRLDPEKFASVMRRLKEEDRIRGVKITGGEPFTDVGLLNEVICILYEIFGYTLELSVSTNGIGLNRMHEIGDLVHLETIHISRHHYDDAVNKSLFGGANVPSGGQLKEIISSVTYRDLFVLNCLLLKDAVNSPEEAHRFLDFAMEIGAPKVGFMTCSPVNAYAERQRIPYESVIRDDDPTLLFTRGFYDYEFCHCSDGVYASDRGGIIEFYGRSTKFARYAYSRGLVYGADNHLRDGFGGEIIV